MKSITVIGSANLDITRYVNEFPDSVENKVDLVGKSESFFGGKGANQALAIKKQLNISDNTKIYFLGCIGNDKNGIEVRKNLSDRDIDVSRVKISNLQTDGRFVIVCTKGKDKGKNRMVGFGECINQITPDYIKQNIDILKKSELIMIQLKMPEETIRYVIEYAYNNNKKLIVDPAPENKIDFLVKEDLLEKITFLTPNGDEAYTLKRLIEGECIDNIKNELKHKINSQDKINQIKNFLISYQNIVVTIDRHGVLYTKKEAGKISVKQKETFKDVPVDSTGAGDTFNGAFAAAIFRNESIDDAIEKGLAASSAKVLHKGAQNGVPTLSETINKIKKERYI